MYTKHFTLILEDKEYPCVFSSEMIHDEPEIEVTLESAVADDFVQDLAVWIYKRGANSVHKVEAMRHDDSWSFINLS